MSVFEYSSILLSVVIGLAITKLLTKLVVLFKREYFFRKYWLQIFTCLTLIWSSVATFFSFFTSNEVSSLGLQTFLLIPFFKTVLLFFSAEFVPVPEPYEDIEDLDTYFMAGFPKLIFISIFLIYFHELIMGIWFTWLSTGQSVYFVRDLEISFFFVITGAASVQIVKRLTFRQTQLFFLITMPIFMGIVLIPTLQLFLNQS